MIVIDPDRDSRSSVMGSFFLVQKALSDFWVVLLNTEQLTLVHSRSFANQKASFISYSLFSLILYLTRTGE